MADNHLCVPNFALTVRTILISVGKKKVVHPWDGAVWTALTHFERFSHNEYRIVDFMEPCISTNHSKDERKCQICFSKPNNLVFLPKITILRVMSHVASHTGTKCFDCGRNVTLTLPLSMANNQLYVTEFITKNVNVK